MSDLKKMLIGVTVYVITGKSESGDNYGPIVATNKPSEKYLKKLTYEWDGIPEEENGPGNYGSYVHLEVNKTKITDCEE